MKFTDVRVVLLGSLYPRNVGACARASANMGAKQLYIVDKKCELDVEAREGAAGAQNPLETAIEYESFEELQSTEPFGCYIALTRRTGLLRQPYPIRQALDKAESLDVPSGPLYLVFGPEDNGLSDEQIKLTNLSAELPVYGDYPSLNLAQAVMLTLFITQEHAFGANEKVEMIQEDSSPFPENLFKDWLIETGYDLNRNKNASSKLTSMIQRSVPTPKEVELLRSALWQNIRKLKELRKG